MSYRNPTPTVDIIIHKDGKILLIKRKNPPFGWALPGGFVDEGETVEQAAIREAKEETGLDVQLETLLYVYSDPRRDMRQHTLSIVFTASSNGTPVAADDATDLGYYSFKELPKLAFDHAEIVADYKVFLESGNRPHPKV
ncbi:MAG: NUDIX hydrolase [Myxococcota bacterium]|nr:NUDIX hydrolase [Myxococcota bacterium]